MVTLFLTLGFVYVFFLRLRLPYNSEGRFYSVKDKVVYDLDALPVFGLLSIIFLLITLGLGLMALRISRSPRMTR